MTRMGQDKVQVRNGAVLLWRLGPLEFGEQSKWPRAPLSRGMWAFPWPAFDNWFAFHQYTYKLPRRFRTDDAGWPTDVRWYRDDQGTTATELPFDDDGHLAAGWELDPAFGEERSAWINDVGVRVVPRRQFWYSGELYTHLRRNGEAGSSGLLGDAAEWHRMDAVDFADAVRRCGGTTAFYRDPDGTLARVRTSVDHLEVFLPPNAGRIHGRPSPTATRTGRGPSSH